MLAYHYLNLVRKANRNIFDLFIEAWFSED